MDVAADIFSIESHHQTAGIRPGLTAKIPYVGDGNACLLCHFPDHGLDIYESSPDYCSHANTSNQASVEAAQRIPFVVYTTEAFRIAHPEVMAQLQQMSRQPFNTEDLPDLLLTIAGYRVVR